MSAPVTPPIIIIKKKGHHGGHHGGAWKVAYADFVTAMMALFIVLWLMTASQETQKAIAGYFRDAKGFGKQTGSAMGGTGESLTITKSNMTLLKGKLEQALRKNPEFEKLKEFVQMTVTGEGLRIELLESEKGRFFENGEAAPTTAGRDLLVQLAQHMSKMQNSLLIEGHTDSKPYDNPRYSNWELSADRANAARKIMQESGLRANQVREVRGFADQQLRLPDKPEDPSNRRISIIVQYPHQAEPGEEKADSKGETGKAGTEKGAAQPPLAVATDGKHGQALATSEKHTTATTPSATTPSIPAR
jgi:chemotaxis protein MotB